MRKTAILFMCLLLTGCGSRTNNLVLESVVRETTIAVPQQEQVTEVQQETTTQQASTEKRGMQGIMGGSGSTGQTAETTDRWAALQKDETDPYESLEQFVEETEPETVDYSIDFGESETVPTMANLETTAQPVHIPGTEAATGSYGPSDLSGIGSPELPTLYKERSPAAVYKDSTVIPDDPNFEKDAYGNYIIPMFFFENIIDYEVAMPFNGYGLIPYCYWYDATGKILNELPAEYNEYKSYFMFGQYEDANDRYVNYTEAYVEGKDGGPGVRGPVEETESQPSIVLEAPGGNND